MVFKRIKTAGGRLPALTSVAMLLALLFSGVEARLSQAQTPSVDKVARRFPRMTKGLNVGRWFHDDDMNYISQVDVNLLSDAELAQYRSLGVRFFRLPVAMKLLTSISNPGAPDPAALAKLDTVIQRLHNYDIAVDVAVFDVNSLTWSGSTAAIRNDHVVKFAAFWKALAAHLSRHDPDRLFLEVLNEPRASTPSIWYDQQKKVLAAMREGAPEHTLLASANMNIGGDFDTMRALEMLAPVDDPNVVYNFHFYKPHAFTHQGANWEGSVPQAGEINGLPYPATAAEIEDHMVAAGYSDSVKIYIRNSLSYGSGVTGQVADWGPAHIANLMNRAKVWADNYSALLGRRIYVTCNEFGVFRGQDFLDGTHKGVAPDARNRWLYDMRTTLEARGIGWGMWENERGFGLGARSEATGQWFCDPATARAVGFTLDVTPPQVAFSTPAESAPGQGVVIGSLDLLKGTAIDETGGSGVTRVEVRLFRSILGQQDEYWNGSAWVSTLPRPGFNAVYRPFDGSWSITANTPPGTNVMPAPDTLTSDYAYHLIAYAYDVMGNRGERLLPFIIDRFAPTISFSTPLDNSAVAALNSISGNVNANGGTPISRVELTLKRVGDGLYWVDNGDGTFGWRATPGVLNANYSDGAWWVVNGTSGIRLPATTNLPDGSYELTAAAINSGGRRAETKIIVIVDRTRPSVAFLSPIQGAVVSNLNAIRGKALDKSVAATSPGSGIDRVELLIQRAADGKYWAYDPSSAGYDWADTPDYRSTNYSPLTTLWSRIIDIEGTNLPQGVKLPEGVYYLTAVAVDRVGNRTSIRIAVTVDKTPGTVAFSTPRDGDFVRSLSTVAGTIVDANGAAGVTLSMQRASDSKYWTGSTWSSAPATLNAALVGSDWSVNTALTDALTISGLYTLTATALDRAGNRASAVITTTVDKIAPGVTISSPANGATLPSLSSVSGTATDSGSGVSRVNLVIKRNANSTWWNGSTWVTAEAGIPAVLSGTNWTCSTALPSSAQFTAGSYTLKAVAFDKIGNSGAFSIGVTSNSDGIERIAPRVAITSPGAGATVSNLNAVSGNASDEVGGSGLSRVNLVIKRNADSKWWNGSTWVTAEAGLPTVLSGTSGTIAWSRTTGMPAGANLPNGSYTLKSVAYDRAGNIGVVSNTITVSATTTIAASTAPASSVALSMAKASAASSMVQLSFSGALNGSAAVDASRYRVTINGQTAALQSAAYESSLYRVTLNLAPSTLRAGDSVVVSWNLLDARGVLLSGQTTVNAS